MIPVLPDAKLKSIIIVLQKNWVAIFSVFMVIIGLVIMLKLNHRFAGVHNPPAKIISINNENYEYLIFLTNA